MSRKEKTRLEWKKVEDSLRWELRNNPKLERVQHILLLSFNDLSFYLKRCFLYCSVFPENYRLTGEHLINLWTAEGFVEEKRGLTMEEVAESYVKELNCRTMLQVAGVDKFTRRKYYRIHDLMHDLALSIATEQNFGMVYDGKEVIHNSETQRSHFNKARRLLIQISSNDIIGTSMPRLCSLIVFGKGIITSSSLNKIGSSFRVLRVLNLNRASIETIPEELCALFNLRYLNLSCSNVKELPKSLGKLRNLQTLDIWNSKVERLPGGMEKMKKLRHLYMSGSMYKFNHLRAVQAPSKICKLECLQILTIVEANEDIVKQVGNLTQLRKLVIGEVRKADGKDLCSSIQKMTRLLYLGVNGISEEETLELEELSSPPPFLQQIYLRGHLEKLPHWIGSLGDLTVLSLNCSAIKEDPLPSIETLLNLKSLELLKASEGQQLCFHAGCFPRLEILFLSCLEHLNHVEIEEGALPSIQVVNLTQCRELKMLPQGIEYLKGLQELYLRRMPEELIDRFRGAASEEKPKVGHIPNIKIGYWRKEKWIYESLS